VKAYLAIAYDLCHDLRALSLKDTCVSLQGSVFSPHSLLHRMKSCNWGSLPIGGLAAYSHDLLQLVLLPIDANIGHIQPFLHRSQANDRLDEVSAANSSSPACSQVGFWKYYKRQLNGFLHWLDSKSDWR
jgi:hypothetical protein